MLNRLVQAAKGAMLIDVIKIPVLVSLGVVVVILAATMWLSVRTA